MHTTIVTTKDGKTYSGTIQEFRPAHNWFSMIVFDPLVNILHEQKFEFSECQTVITQGERLSISTIGDMDEIGRARRCMIDGRKFHWKEFGIEYPQEKFDWE